MNLNELKDTRELVVIDEKKNVRHTLKHFIEKGGHRVRLARDQHDGIQKAMSMFCSGVVLDMQMPGMDGVAVAKQIKRFRPHLPIIGCTGYYDDYVEPAGPFISDWVKKPIGNRRSAKKLLDAIERNTVPINKLLDQISLEQESKERVAKLMNETSKLLAQSGIAKRLFVEIMGSEFVDKEKLSAIEKDELNTRVKDIQENAPKFFDAIGIKRFE